MRSWMVDATRRMIRSHIAWMLFVVLCSAHGVAADSPDTKIDVRLKLAELQNSAIAKQEAEVKKAEEAVIEAVDAAIARLDVGKIERIFGTLSAFRPFVKDLRQQGMEILAREEAYAKSLSELQDALRDAPAAFQQAAGLYTQYAEEESYKSIADDYRSLAKTFAVAAKRMADRSSEIKEEEKEIASVLDYVRHENQFLGRFDAFLQAYPENPGGQEREQFLEQLKRYARGMEKLRELLRKFNDKLVPEIHPSGTSTKAIPLPGSIFPPPAEPEPQPAPKVDPPTVLKVDPPTVLKVDANGIGVAPANGATLNIGQRVNVRSPRGNVIGVAVVVSHSAGEYRVRSISGGAVLTGDSLLAQVSAGTSSATTVRR